MILLQLNLYNMKRIFLGVLCGTLLLTSCNEYNQVLKTTNSEYKYEAAKAFFVEGQYSKAAQILTDLMAILKGSVYGEESLYMLAMSEYCSGNVETAAAYFKKYYQSYPKGRYVEEARFYSGKSLFEGVPDARLDQSNTLEAIKEFQDFLDLYPYTRLKPQSQEMILKLQDKLVEKEYLAAKLYYDLGTYMGNCTSGGSNYEACIVTAQNALDEYPYASPERREELSIMLLRARYHLARQSVQERQEERYRATIDEYYAFENDFPESKYLSEARSMLAYAQKQVKE